MRRCCSTRAAPSRCPPPATRAIPYTRSGSSGITIRRRAKEPAQPRSRWWPTDAAPRNARRHSCGGSWKDEAFFCLPGPDERRDVLTADLDLADPWRERRLALGPVRPADPHLRRLPVETHHLDGAIQRPVA